MPDTDLSTLVDLERFSGLSLLEIEAVKTQAWPHVFGCDQPAWKCEACHEDLKAVRRVIAAVQPMVEQDHLVDLSAAGRLLPEGATSHSQFLLRWVGADHPTLEWGPRDLDHAHELAMDPPEWASAGEIVEREHSIGPWVHVGSVAVERHSDG